MKINKYILVFLVVLVLFSLSNLYFYNKEKSILKFTGNVILDSNKNAILNSSKNISSESITKAKLIVEYDHVLTSSIENYILTGDIYWKNNYDETSPKLDNLIQQLENKSIEENNEYLINLFKNLDVANLD